jgi:hypothetical protein
MPGMGHFRSGPERRLSGFPARAQHVTFLAERDIQGAAFLTNIFHEWPSFHDAEIVRVTLRREPRSASLEFVIHVFATPGGLDSEGHFLHRDHTLARIRFDGVEQLKLEDFNRQNAIDDLEIEPSTCGGKGLVVDIPANNGCDASFLCDSISVISAEPYTHDERIRDCSVYARHA